MTDHVTKHSWDWSRHAARIGRMRSDAKTRASRLNGRLGGRRPQGVSVGLWHAARATALAQGLDHPAMRGGPRISDRLLRWDPDQREGVWNVPKETELPG